uniref:Selenoprotein F n=1 Tax=Exaiptasia diaphana TaxID=2652724 RepID=A0A913X530_EXADI
MDWRVSLSSFLSLFFTLFHLSSSKLTPEKCRELGFSSNLLCGSCDELVQFKMDQQFVDNCRSCCHEEGESQAASKRFASATLEVCNCKLGRFPQIQAFVRSEKPDKFPNLRIEFVRGADPILKLHSEDGSVQEELSIEKWNTDSVEEFLTEKLQVS